MEIRVKHGSPAKLAVPFFLALVYEEEREQDSWLQEFGASFKSTLARLIETGAITGKFKEFHLIHPEGDAATLILIGAGKKKEFGVDRFRSIVAKGCRIARRLKAAELGIPVGSLVSLDPSESAAAAAEGAVLGLYRFHKYKNWNESSLEFPSRIILVPGNSKEIEEAEFGARKGEVVAGATNFTRDLVNEPSNEMTPTIFSKNARQVAAECGVGIQILEKEEVEKLGMGAFLSVAKGSEEPPKMIVLKYAGDPGNSFVLGLVGKGVTFDSGGISIKPSENMQAMTSDMAGAAACLGAVKAIATLKIPVNVTAVLPLAENLPDGKAYKPGDIVKSYSGKTIEIINTDAEGRLLLCDALSYARTLGVSGIVDLATLTGAVGVALGTAASGLFCNHEGLAESLMEAGEAASERLWRLPLFDSYLSIMRGSFADLKNSGGRQGGACTAAAFLKEFVGDTPWAHLDIAGTALVESDKTPYQERPYLPKSGATGVGVRTLVLLAEKLGKRKAF